MVVSTIVICPNCGKDTPEGKFCEHCGASVQITQTFQQPVAQQPVYASQPAAPTKIRNVSIAAILSVWTGLGQAYNGQMRKGLGLFAVLIIFYEISVGMWRMEFFSVLALIVWVYGIYDAYAISTKLNNGALPYTEINAGQIVGFIIASVIIGFVLTAIMPGIMYDLKYAFY